MVHKENSVTRFKIGELAQRTGCLVETVRYYERIGLLPEPVRTENKYRAYNDEHVDRLRFIRHCRALDMTIDEIRELVEIRSRPEGNCTEADELLDRHIGQLTERIAALQALEAQLRHLRSRCGSVGTSGDCGILHALDEIESKDIVTIPRR
jgi:Cd(II)/Pb(II)-responsive transcriptional regulator